MDYNDIQVIEKWFLSSEDPLEVREFSSESCCDTELTMHNSIIVSKDQREKQYSVPQSCNKCTALYADSRILEEGLRSCPNVVLRSD